MLNDFLVANRAEILARARTRVAARRAPVPTEVELTTGLPAFLDQLVHALRLALSSDVIDHDAITTAAAEHGSSLLRQGFTVAQVVHDYGDLCQVITELVVEQGSAITTEEFRTLNLCLDDAIAGAVTEYARLREGTIRDEGTERLGVLAHEMRNVLNAAMLSFDSIKRGVVAPGGSTSLLHGRSLLNLRNLIDRSLADVRLDAGMQNLEPVGVAELMEEVEISAYIQAGAREIHFTVAPVDAAVTVAADRQILAAAAANLLQNAFKFTPRGGHVSLTARATPKRVLIEVADECGGLPPGRAEELFKPFHQRGADRSGLGLGLSISLKAVNAMHGELRVHDHPGKGCVFTIDLPRRPPPAAASRRANVSQIPRGASRRRA